MRRVLTLVLVPVVLLLLSVPALAGAWATATLEAPAPTPVAGVETDLGFRILQHGVTPAPWVTARFVATHLASGDQVSAPMTADGLDGRFVTSVTFPVAGDWTWLVQLTELGTDQEGAGGTLTVTAAGDAAAAGDTAAAGTSADAARLADLEQRLDAALARVGELERRLATLEAEAAAAR